MRGGRRGSRGEKMGGEGEGSGRVQEDRGIRETVDGREVRISGSEEQDRKQRRRNGRGVWRDGEDGMHAPASTWSSYTLLCVELTTVALLPLSPPPKHTHTSPYLAGVQVSGVALKGPQALLSGTLTAAGKGNTQVYAFTQHTLTRLTLGLIYHQYQYYEVTAAQYLGVDQAVDVRN